MLGFRHTPRQIQRHDRTYNTKRISVTRRSHSLFLTPLPALILVGLGLSATVLPTLSSGSTLWCPTLTAWRGRVSIGPWLWLTPGLLRCLRHSGVRIWCGCSVSSCKRCSSSLSWGVSVDSIRNARENLPAPACVLPISHESVVYDIQSNRETHVERRSSTLRREKERLSVYGM